ncbi:MAG: hypothetical protein GC159_07800 [Phycisphaera sp.]|nr:hypothetical protein [Phycisphaera sp.]
MLIAVLLLPGVLVGFGTAEWSRDKHTSNTVRDFVAALQSRDVDAAYAMMAPDYRDTHDVDMFTADPVVARVLGGERIDVGEALAPTKWVARSAPFNLGGDSGAIHYESDGSMAFQFGLGGEVWITALTLEKLPKKLGHTGSGILP